MHNSKLVRYLSTFDKNEWKGFRNYLKGTIGESSDGYSLYRLIEKEKNNLKSKKLYLDYVIKKHFPNKARKSVLNIMSILKTEIEEFWTWQEVQSEQRDKDYFKLKALNKREFYTEANKLGFDILAQTQQENRIDLWDDYYVLLVNHELYFSHNPIKNGKKGKTLLRECLGRIESVRSNLSLYYHSAALNRERLYREDWDAILTQEKFSEYSLLQESLRAARNAVSHDDIEAAKKIVALLLSDKNIIAEDLALVLFIYTKEVFARIYVNGKLGKIEEFVDFIIRATQKGRVLYKGIMPQFLFLNNLKIVLRLGNAEQAKKYLEETKIFLPAKDSPMLLRISQNRILFKEEKFDELIQNIMSNKSTDVFEKRNEHELLVKVYMTLYTDDVDFLTSQLRNFRTFLHRHKNSWSKESYQGFLNFIDICTIICRGGSKRKVVERIDELGNVYFRPWLEEKIGAMA